MNQSKARDFIVEQLYFPTVNFTAKSQDENDIIKGIKNNNLGESKVIEHIRNSPRPIKIELLPPHDKQYEYIFRLLQSCTKSLDKNIDVWQITYNNKVGYSFKDVEIKKHCHNRNWRLRERHDGYKLVFNYYLILAESYIDSILTDYIEKNVSLYRYLIVQQLMVNEDKQLLKVPLDIEFYSELFMFIKSSRWKNYKREIYEDIDKYKSAFLLGECDEKIKHVIIFEILQQLKYLRIKTERELEQRTSYARAFQTKRYITHKTQNVMNNNIFLEHYGYVELDNDVALDRFRKLEKDFQQLKSVIAIPIAKDHSFRIKKLGKHRAQGIYFAHSKATILDIEHPQSYAHELAHQIDYTMGNESLILSEDISFRHVIDQYKSLVSCSMDNLPADSPFKNKWHGKTKYNRD